MGICPPPPNDPKAQHRFRMEMGRWGGGRSEKPLPLPLNAESSQASRTHSTPSTAAAGSDFLGRPRRLPRAEAGTGRHKHSKQRGIWKNSGGGSFSRSTKTNPSQRGAGAAPDSQPPWGSHPRADAPNPGGLPLLSAASDFNPRDQPPLGDPSAGTGD